MLLHGLQRPAGDRQAPEEGLSLPHGRLSLVVWMVVRICRVATSADTMVA